jgi:type I restriction enzyme M protein
MQSYSSLFKLYSDQLTSEADVEFFLLVKIFADLGFTDHQIVPRARVPSLFVNDGVTKKQKVVDFLLCDKAENPRVVVEAKAPSEKLDNAWGQAAAYALSHNADKEESRRIRFLLISNGRLTSLFKHDNSNALVTLQLSDFASGSPPYVSLRNHIKVDSLNPAEQSKSSFKPISPSELNRKFASAHQLVWKKEKLNPTDAFFEFCKFIFLKIKEDRLRNAYDSTKPRYSLPLTSEWLEAQVNTSEHPVRDVLFQNLHRDLEAAISNGSKRRIFEPQETLNLSPSTCQQLISDFEHIDLSSIDEDLNGRMFEVFLSSAIQGKELGQYFTPRPVVDFITRIGLFGFDVTDPPKIIDACAGTAGFLIEAMAYLVAGLREDNRFTNTQKEELRSIICNESLFGIEGNERVSRIARINMYLHGDGGSHIFHGDGLDSNPDYESGVDAERVSELEHQRHKICNGSFDLVLSNPPFSMDYSASKDDERKILEQREFLSGHSSVKSNTLFVERYLELLRPGAEMLIVLDDTFLNGAKLRDCRIWLLKHFVLLGVHSLPFNTFFKAKANIKTSILHLRKKSDAKEEQGHVFMSISNNVGHDNALNDTPNRNNLNNIFNAFAEWKRTGELKPSLTFNQDVKENLECPQQIWIEPPDRITSFRLDAFNFSPKLKATMRELKGRVSRGEVELLNGGDFEVRAKLTSLQKLQIAEKQELIRYVEISDVSSTGLISSETRFLVEDMPTRAQYQIFEGDILFALNISSRGTVARVTKKFDGAFCTSGFLVIVPDDNLHGQLLFYALRSEQCREQVYYLSQTASQPELKTDTWKNQFVIPFPLSNFREEAVQKTIEYLEAIEKIENFTGACFH